MTSASKHTFKPYLLALSIILLPACGKNTGEKLDLATQAEANFAEYEGKVTTAIEKNHKHSAQTHLQALINEFPDDQRTAEHRLRLADLYFEEGKKRFDNDALKAACELYKKFYTLSPSDERAEYSSYRAILSKFYQTHRIDCDTRHLENALKGAKEHIERSEFTKKAYHKDVRDIVYTCERKLIDKELYVFKSYMRQGKLQSADTRLTYVREQYLPKHPELEARLVYLECKLLRAKKDEDWIPEKVAFLKQHHSDSEFTVLANNLLNKKNFLF